METPAKQREHIKEAILAYGEAMRANNPLLVRLAAAETEARIQVAVPDKLTLENVGGKS